MRLPVSGSLRKALKRKCFRPSAKWPFQTTYVSAVRWSTDGCWVAGLCGKSCKHT